MKPSVKMQIKITSEIFVQKKIAIEHYTLPRAILEHI